ncbi:MULTISPECIES: NAD(P)/FAD-dependent oxidoreductase [Aequorivita]|uniref:FAD-binding oxidoreductase n=1 Tax=Aequorivita iocasae TaxID=2803865 RepID=A0ABX7DUY9_9FLAO|nr:MULTISPECIES: FAD-dependent oxidoreductase [Aequorivita]QQX77976.1 FAD-binding oxidoreductase [Aequorivita iocasae]UCA57479.1 FAD-binding oxidoreductase [Aequorivita sp. F7]
MIEKDYIIVGLGIAGITLCEQLQNKGKSFVVIDNGAEGSTAKSGGVFNPTVLKRFTAAWNASDFFPVAVNFYKTLSDKIGEEFFIKTPILRVFKSVEEQNNWSVASDKKDLRQFLSSEFLKNKNPAVNAPFGFGKVLGTAQIQTDILLSEYRNFLLKTNNLVAEVFQYKDVVQKENGVIYKNISAKKIIFAEGAKAIENPFFPKQTLIGNKGEYVIIYAPELKIETLLKGPVYVIPLGKDHYKVGATYSRDDYSVDATEEAKEEILSKLKTFINCPFELVGQTAGVRPTTKDHRPLLGNLIESPNLVFFNGLGSRGFLMAPMLSEILFNYLEKETPLPKEMDITRML